MTTEREDELIKLITRIHAEEDSARRMILIRSFQDQIWNAPRDALDTQVGRILEELAGDLDFYEPDPIARREAQLGDEGQLSKNIESAMAQLRKLGVVFSEL